jgi:hypothetical protein
VIVVIESIYGLYYIYWFSHVEPSLNPWNETKLIMVYGLYCVVGFVFQVCY